jgi:hypothetical protein
VPREINRVSGLSGLSTASRCDDIAGNRSKRAVLAGQGTIGGRVMIKAGALVRLRLLVFSLIRCVPFSTGSGDEDYGHQVPGPLA